MHHTAVGGFAIDVYEYAHMHVCVRSLQLSTLVGSTQDFTQQSKLCWNLGGLAPQKKFENIKVQFW